MRTILRTAAAVAASSFILAACGSHTPTPSQHRGSPSAKTTTAAPTTVQQLAEWGATYLPNLDAMQTDFVNISANATAGNVAALGTNCATLQGDVFAAQQSLPSPDSQLNTLLGKALSAISDSADACVAGDMTTATDDITIGTGFLNQANARIAQIGGN
jgi:hypothetical protein